jgi:catechol 2,3-dioxygenase
VSENDVRTGPTDPEPLEATNAPAPARISAGLTLGPVHLTVASLERSIDYYRRAVGLAVLGRTTSRTSLGAGGRELLVLVEEQGARPATRHPGLYHFALLVPERADLARWLAHAARDQVALTGLADHAVSEAVYLTDPDAHGIEIYCDRPRERWEGRVGEQLTTQRLDVDDLMSTLEDPARAGFDGLPDGTVMGHVHFRVVDLEPAIAFYRDVLGLPLMAQLGDQAAFLAAGGYHHHVGANTWESRGAPPAPPKSAVLRHATFVLPDEAERERVLARLRAAGVKVEESVAGPLVRDPSGNGLRLVVAES